MSAFFTERERSLLVQVLDRLVPRDGEMPGAGEVGVPEYLERVARRDGKSGHVILGALKKVEATAGNQYGQPFEGLAPGEKDAVLRLVEQERPEFFQALVEHSYSGYYTNQDVLRRLCPDARPPQPGGYEVEPFDPGTLDKVRELGPRYRG